MTRLFFDHLVQIEEVFLELDNFEMTIEEKDEFISIIDGTIHNRTLEVILTHLPEEHHKKFLTMLHEGPHHPRLLDFIKEKSSVDIESEIIKEAEKAKKEILSEIRKSKKK